MDRQRRPPADLFDEIVARIEETDLSVPVRKGPWLYYSRTVEGSSYAIHCRRPVDGARRSRRSPTSRSCWTRTCWPRATTTSPSGTSRSAPTTAAGSTPPTPPEASGTPCASSTWPPGSESPEVLEDTSYGSAWANDNPTVFFVRVDEAMRPYQLWRHRVGTDPAADGLVYEEPDDHFYLGVGRTKDDRYILCVLDSKVTSEARALRRRRPPGSVLGHRAPSPGDRVQRRPRPGRRRAGTDQPVPHRDQRRGRGLPADGGPRRHPGPGPLERSDPGPARGQARQRRSLRRAPGGLRTGRGARPGSGPSTPPPAPPTPWTSPNPRRRCGAAPTRSTTRPSCATTTRR